MKKLALLFLLVAPLALGQTETFYVCEGGDGSLPETATCATAYDAADFNIAGNWDTDDQDDGKIGPNDTVMFMDDAGLIRISGSGTATITVQQPGLSGKPITLKNQSGDSPVIVGSDIMTFTDESNDAITGPIWYGGSAGDDVGFILMGTESEANVGTKVATRLGSNLVTNGDMEAGDPPSNWNATSASLDGVADVPAGGGAQSIEITTTAGNGRAVHTATSVTAEKLYQLELYYKNTGGDVAQYRIWDISNGTNIINYTDLADSAAWSSKQTFYFMTSSGTAEINVVLSGKANGDVVYFDEVTVKLSNLDSSREYFIDTGDGDEVYVYANGDTPTNTYGTIEVPQRQFVLNILDKDYITVDGLAGKYSYSAVFRTMDGAYNIFQDCTVSYAGGYDIGGGVRAGNGIQINGDATYNTITDSAASQLFDWGFTAETYDGGSTENMSNITITDNTVDQCGGGIGINTEGGQGSTLSEVDVLRNNITSVGSGWSGIDNSLGGKGIGVKETVSGTADRVYDVDVEDNTINGFTYSGLDQYEGGPIYYRRNWITGGTGTKDGTPDDAAILFNGNDFGDTDDECTALVAYNIIFDNTCHGINITNNTPSDGSDALNAINIYNNTIYNSHDTGESDASFHHQASDRINSSNNIIYTTDYYAMETPNTHGFLTSDNNIFLADSADVILRGVTARTLAEWQSDESLDGSSLNSDPLFYDAASDDFRIVCDSPAISAGTSVSLTQDYDGNFVPLLGEDIGAYESQCQIIIISEEGGTQR